MALPCDDIKIDTPRRDAMSDVLECASQHIAGLYEQVSMLALYGLDAAQFIQADGAFATLGPVPDSGIGLTPLNNLCISACICYLG